MLRNSTRNALTANVTASLSALCWLLTALGITACGTQPPAPPVLFKPATFKAPIPELMAPPKPSGEYLKSAEASLERWEQMLRDSLPKSEDYKPGLAQP